MEFSRFYDNHSELVNDFKNTSWHRRRKVAYILQTYNHPDAVHMLVSLLEDDNQEVREQAAFSLGIRQDAQGLAPLIALLLDKTRHPYYEDMSTDWSVVTALKQYGEIAAKELIPHLDKPYVIYVLGEIGHHVAVDPLIDLHKKGYQSTAIIHALGKIGSKNALPYLTSIENPDRWVSEAIEKITTA